ncbi:MAG: hypothetical protein ACO1ON_13170 [Nocardioides sp.]
MARSNGGNGGSFYDLVIQVVSTSDTQYTLRAVVYLTSQNVVDSVNNLAVGGDWARSGSLALNGVYAASPVWSQDIVIDRVYGSTVTATVTAAWSGVEFWGATLSASESYVVPARPWSPPVAPSSVAVSRVSDASQAVTWVRNVTTAAPYEALGVHRRDNVVGTWVGLASLAGTATSYTDTTTVANRQYEYRVLAVNSSGSALSATSSPISTTPAAPSSAAAAKSGSDIVVTWVDNATAETGFTVERSENGGAYGNAATVGAGVTTWTHSAPSAGSTWRYRVRSTVTTPSLSSAWAESNTIQLAAAPNAPTGLGPAGAHDATEDVTLTWVHNPVDTSPQTEFQVRHRASGSGTWTTETAVTSGTSAWVLAADTYTNGQTIEWQVRTWGQYVDPSPYSATATLTLSGRPTALINAPGDGSEVDTSVLVVEWGFADPEGAPQASWSVELYDSTDTLVESRSGSGTATSVAMTTPLPDDTSWTVRVRVRDAAGLWSTWDTSTFTVAYALPPAPAVALTWDRHAATVQVEITNPVPIDPQVPADHVEVYRSIGDGPWELIATGVPPDTTITDWSPPTTGAVRYRVEAVSVLPSIAATVETVQTGGTAAVFISGGPGFATVCAARHGQAVTETAGRVRVLRQYAGRDLPIERAGVARERVLTLSADLVGEEWGSAPWSQWAVLSNLPGPHLWRDPDGRRLLVFLSQVQVARPRGSAARRLSLTATEVDGA